MIKKSYAMLVTTIMAIGLICINTLLPVMGVYAYIDIRVMFVMCATVYFGIVLIEELKVKQHAVL